MSQRNEQGIFECEYCELGAEAIRFVTWRIAGFKGTRATRLCKFCYENVTTDDNYEVVDDNEIPSTWYVGSVHVDGKLFDEFISDDDDEDLWQSLCHVGFFARATKHMSDVALSLKEMPSQRELLTEEVIYQMTHEYEVTVSGRWDRELEDIIPTFPAFRTAWKHYNSLVTKYMDRTDEYPTITLWSREGEVLSKITPADFVVNDDPVVDLYDSLKND